MTVKINGVTVQHRSFDGKYFQGRTLTVEGTPKEKGVTVDSWRVTIKTPGGSAVQAFPGSKLSIVIPNCTSLAIESVLGRSAIDEIGADRNDGTLDYDSPVDVYDMAGRQVMGGVSVTEASSCLPAGIYVMRQGQLSVKTVIR